MKSKSSTSSAASEGSASDSNEPDLFGQLPSASESRSAGPSSKSTGPTRQSTTTSKPSTQIDLEELTSSAAGSPVNRGPQPGSSEAQKMTEISGRSWLPLLKTYSLNGSLAKTCEVLLTSCWASSAAFLTWKASDTKPSHLLFQLAPSMPRTDEIASGLWPTPVTPAGGGERTGNRAGTGSLNYMARTGKLWPTPTGQDNAQVRGEGKTVGTKRGKTLGGAVRMWPTPAAHEARLGYQDRTRGKKGSQKSLTTEVIDDMGGRQATTGQLNPTWVEWLMGFPTGYTDLKPSEMPSSRKSSRKSAKQSSRQNRDPA